MLQAFGQRPPEYSKSVSPFSRTISWKCSIMTVSLGFKMDWELLSQDQQKRDPKVILALSPPQNNPE